MADSKAKGDSPKKASEPVDPENQAQTPAQEERAAAEQSVTGDPEADKPVWNRETQGDPPPGREDQYDVVDGTESVNISEQESSDNE